MGRTACTEPQGLYSGAIPLLPLWAVWPVQSLSACTRVHFTFLPFKSVTVRVYRLALKPLDATGDMLKVEYHVTCAILWNVVDCFWNVMAHAQKPDFVFRRNRRVHLNRPGEGGQFSRLLAGELCTSACRVCTVLLVQACVDAYWLPTPFSCFPLLLHPCVTVCHHISTGVYSELNYELDCRGNKEVVGSIEVMSLNMAWETRENHENTRAKSACYIWSLYLLNEGRWFGSDFQ
jgi:hypothetical protein